MSEYKFKFSGWKAIVAIVVLIGIFGLRLMTFNDKKDDTDLMRKIELQLLTDYFPDDVQKLKAVLETGNRDKVREVVKSITTTEINVESVKVSQPLFSFSTSKEVVVKVTYSLNDASGTRDAGTNYYLFSHGSLGNVWQYKYDVSVVSYYLNFF